MNTQGISYENLKKQMKDIFIFFIICSIAFISHTQGQTTSLNSDFELGDFTGWSASNGRINRSTGQITFTNNTITTNRQTIISNLYYDRYTCGELPSIPPDGGNYVAKLGNDIKGAEVEQLRYQLKVTEENSLFLYKYAVVFEDPGHEPHEQPFFDVAVRDNNGRIIDSLCGYDHIVSGEGIQGFYTCEVHKDPRNPRRDTIVRWKPWTSIALDLTPYIGQIVTLEFTNADCRLGGHWSYAYMEVITGSMRIQVKACESDSTATLKAPDGFSSYVWSNGETTQEIHVPLIEGESYSCQMMSITDCYVTLFADILIERLSIPPTNETICKGQGTTISAEGADYYEWDNNLGVGAQKTVYPLETTTYTVTGITENGCVAQGTSTVNVIDLPTVSLQANVPCSGGDLLLQAESDKDIVSYNWAGPLSFTSHEQNPIINAVTYEHTGNYTLTVEDANGCKNNASLKASINPSPEITTTHSNACEGGDVVLRVFPANLQYEWTGGNNFSSTNQFNTLSNINNSMAGTYKVVATNEFNCTDTATINLDVYPSPKAQFSHTTPCLGTAMVFTNESVGATEYNWSFGNGRFSYNRQPSPVEYSTAQEYTVSLQVFNEHSCSDSISMKVKSHAVPVAHFSTDKACVGDTYTIQNTSYVEHDAITSWQWTIRETNIENEYNPTVELINEEPIPVTLIVRTDYCSDTLTKEILSYPKPVLSPFQSNGCAPLEVQFPTIVQERVFHAWDFDDGETSQSSSPTHYFFNTSNKPIIYHVKHKATSEYGCVDSIIYPIEVFSQPKTNFTLSRTSICSGQSLEVTNTTEFANFFEWELEDGERHSQESFTVSYTNSGNNVKYVPITLHTNNSSMCFDSLVKFVAVYPFPDKGIDLSDSLGCSPLIVNLSTESLAPNYEWKYGDGTEEIGGNTVEHIFINRTADVIEYPITLKVSTNQGCEAEFYSRVTVYPSPDASFVIDTNYGCSPFSTTIENTTKGATHTYWEFDEDTLFHHGEQSFPHTFTNNTQDQQSHRLTIYARNQYDCKDKHSLSLLVFPEVKANFTVSPTKGCSPLNSHFTNYSTGATSYNWIFNDGTFSSNVHTGHTYINTSQNTLIREAQLVAISDFGCVDTSDAQTIEIFPQPQAQFTTDNVSGCSPLHIHIEDNSIGAEEYTWVYGNGEESNQLNSTQLYENKDGDVRQDEIKLFVKNQYECKDTATQTITVYPQVIADFSPEISGCSPLLVQFSNHSQYGESYSWDFGDEKVSTDKNPYNTFLNNSVSDTIYTVRLIGNNHFKCSDTAYKTIRVYPSITASFVADTLIGCSPMSTKLLSTTQGASHIEWIIDNQLPQNVQEEMLLFESSNSSHLPQVHTVELRVRNEYSCASSYIQAIQVYPEVIADFSPSHYSGCSPLDINFFNNSSGANTYFWDFGDNSSATNTNPGHSYLNYNSTEKLYNISLVAQSTYGCKAYSDTTTITVYPQPMAQFHIEKNSGCSPLTTKIYDESDGATRAVWNINNETFINEEIDSYTYTNNSHEPIRSYISLIVSNEYSCEDSANEPITIYPEVIAGFIKPENICSPAPVQFENISEHAHSYEWNFGDGNKSQEKNPIYVYENVNVVDTNYTITLKTHSSYGCKDSTKHTVTVYPTPKAAFTPNSSQFTLPDAVLTLQNRTKGEWNYEWKIDGYNISNTTTPEPVLLTNTGVMAIELIAYSQYCIDTSLQHIRIYGPPIVADYDSSFAGCSPLTVTFTNKSLNAIEYEWDFGDGTTSTEIHPTHTFLTPGTYVIQLTARNGDLEDITRAHAVTVYKNPKADFSVAPLVVYLPEAEISLYNSSIDAEEVRWYVENTLVSEEYQPSHTFTSEGNFNISLSVSSRHGCIDSVSSNQPIKVLYDCDIKFPNIFTPTTQNSDGYYDSTIPETENDIFHPIFLNIVDYNLQIFNRWGEIVFESNELERGWNGWYRDELSKSDVYIWKCDAQCLGGKRIQQVGNVTLLR